MVSENKYTIYGYLNYSFSKIEGSQFEKKHYVKKFSNETQFLIARLLSNAIFPGIYDR